MNDLSLKEMYAHVIAPPKEMGGDSAKKESAPESSSESSPKSYEYTADADSSLSKLFGTPEDDYSMLPCGNQSFTKVCGFPIISLFRLLQISLVGAG